MSKLTVQDLASVLVENDGLASEKAEQFVKVMFELVIDELINEKVVKIKGLGTFKMIDVSARESVNVNSGERVVIDGHSKINFVPEQTLKDLVNKPFSQFETVMLNDGVDFSNIDETDSMILDGIHDDPFFSVNGQELDSPKTDNHEKDNQESDIHNIDNQEYSENNIVPIQLNVVNSENNGNDFVQDDEKESDSKDEVVSGECQNDDGVVSNEDQDKETKDSSISENDKADHDDILKTDTVKIEFVDDDDETECQEQETKKQAVLLEQVDEESNKLVEEPIPDNFGDKPKRWSVWRKIGVVFFSLLLLLVGFLLGYEEGKYTLLTTSINNLFSSHTTVEHRVIKPLVIQHQSNNTKRKPVKSHVKVKNTKEPPFIVKDSVPKEKPNSNIDFDKCNKANVQVRYGAYNIVGVDRIVTMKKGRTLKSIAVHDFGSEEMVYYIYALNGLGENDEVKAGDEIMVPKLKLRHKKRK